VATVRHVDRVTTSVTPVAGARCRGTTDGTCKCRNTGDDEETEPPRAGEKRLELRMSAHGGTARVSGGLGSFGASGGTDTCYYVDVPAGTTVDVAFNARADRPAEGVIPRFSLAEYGPRGPYWYRIIDVECRGPEGRCTREGVQAWAERNLKERKRGRLDPCGSTVVSKLAWDAGNGQSQREGGLYGDLSVRFALEVKKFDTQFAPGSTECVPK
jgi:hypothetical protein